MDVKDLLRSKSSKKDNSYLSLQEGSELVLSEYEITREALHNNAIRRLPSRVRKQIEQLYGLIYNKPDEAISSLLELIEKYPYVPMLDNYLMTAYRLAGQKEKADSLTVESYKKYPDYLFAKVNYAFYCLQKGDPNKIPEIFDHKMDLRLLYPERKKFHLTEFMSFMGVMGCYYYAIGEREIAIRYYDMIKQVDPDYGLVKVLQKILYPSFLGRLLRKITKKPFGNVM